MINYSDAYWRDVQEVSHIIPNRSKLCGKKVLITGGTGMICSSVAEILFYMNREEDMHIEILLAGRSRDRVAERFHIFLEGTDYSFVEYDATKRMDQHVEADYIIHGASNANPTVYTRQPVETILANVVGLDNLLNMVSQAGTGRLLYISSSEVYGNQTENRPYRENDYGFLDILNQRASYPSAKRASETLCIAYGIEYGVDTVIVRPGHIYGPSITESDSRASAQFTRNVVAGKDIVMKSAGTQVRSYCYTLDCASAVLTVLLNGQTGNAYNISNKNSICTISDIAQFFACTVGRKVLYENATDEEKKGYNLMTNSSLDASKLEDLGWKALFDLKRGTKKTVEYLKCKGRINE